jgi:hypothetical protein
MQKTVAIETFGLSFTADPYGFSVIKMHTQTAYIFLQGGKMDWSISGTG